MSGKRREVMSDEQRAMSGKEKQRATSNELKREVMSGDNTGHFQSN
jgi:hypothetical protein